MSEQLVLELGALRTECDNLRAALHTAERMLGEFVQQRDGASEADKNAQACTLLYNIAQLPPLPPYGIHGNTFPGAIWPDPAKIDFSLERNYDPLSLLNREKPLNLTHYRETPRRRRTDLEREAED